MIRQLCMQVHLYSMYGVQLPQQFSMGSEVQRDGILDCQLYSDGIVVLTKALQLWAVSGLQDPRPQKLANPKLKEAPNCMTIFEPRHTLSGCLEVIAACWLTTIAVTGALVSAVVLDTIMYTLVSCMTVLEPCHCLALLA